MQDTGNKGEGERSVFTYTTDSETRRIAEESQENAAVTDGFLAYIVSLRLPYPYMPALR